MNPVDRYQVCDPELKELVVTFPMRFEAFRCARREAETRGYGMEVYDAMARYGQTNLWRVSSTGEVANQSTKCAKEETRIPEPTFAEAQERLARVFQRLIAACDTIPDKQPPEERDLEERAVRG